MSVIEAFIAELGAAIEKQTVLVDGGSNAIDINFTPSTYLPETFELVLAKQGYDATLLAQLKATLDGVTALQQTGYPGKKVFDATPAILADLKAKQDAIDAFLAEIDEKVVLELAAEPIQPVEKTGKAKAK